MAFNVFHSWNFFSLRLFSLFCEVFCWRNGFESLNHSQDSDVMCHLSVTQAISWIALDSKRELWLEPRRHNIYQLNNISLGMLSILPTNGKNKLAKKVSNIYYNGVNITNLLIFLPKGSMSKELLWFAHSKRKVNLHLCLHFDIPLYHAYL